MTGAVVRPGLPGVGAVGERILGRPLQVGDSRHLDDHLGRLSLPHQDAIVVGQLVSIGVLGGLELQGRQPVRYALVVDGAQRAGRARATVVCRGAAPQTLFPVRAAVAVAVAGPPQPVALSAGVGDPVAVGVQPRHAHEPLQARLAPVAVRELQPERGLPRQRLIVVRGPAQDTVPVQPGARGAVSVDAQHVEHTRVVGPWREDVLCALFGFEAGDPGEARRHVDHLDCDLGLGPLAVAVLHGHPQRVAAFVGQAQLEGGLGATLQLEEAICVGVELVDQSLVLGVRSVHADGEGAPFEGVARDRDLDGVDRGGQRWVQHREGQVGAGGGHGRIGVRGADLGREDPVPRPRGRESHRHLDGGPRRQHPGGRRQADLQPLDVRPHLQRERPLDGVAVAHLQQRSGRLGDGQDDPLRSPPHAEPPPGDGDQRHRLVICQRIGRGPGAHTQRPGPGAAEPVQPGEGQGERDAPVPRDVEHASHHALGGARGCWQRLAIARERGPERGRALDHQGHLGAVAGDGDLDLQVRLAALSHRGRGLHADAGRGLPHLIVAGRRPTYPLVEHVGHGQRRSGAPPQAGHQLYGDPQHTPGGHGVGSWLDAGGHPDGSGNRKLVLRWVRPRVADDRLARAGQLAGASERGTGDLEAPSAEHLQHAAGDSAAVGAAAADVVYAHLEGVHAGGRDGLHHQRQVEPGTGAHELASDAHLCRVPGGGPAPGPLGHVRQPQCAAGGDELGGRAVDQGELEAHALAPHGLHHRRIQSRREPPCGRLQLPHHRVFTAQRASGVHGVGQHALRQGPAGGEVQRGSSLAAHRHEHLGGFERCLDAVGQREQGQRDLILLLPVVAQHHAHVDALPVVDGPTIGLQPHEVVHPRDERRTAHGGLLVSPGQSERSLASHLDPVPGAQIDEAAAVPEAGAVGVGSHQVLPAHPLVTPDGAGGCGAPVHALPCHGLLQRQVEGRVRACGRDAHTGDEVVGPVGSQDVALGVHSQRQRPHGALEPGVGLATERCAPLLDGGGVLHDPPAGVVEHEEVVGAVEGQPVAGAEVRDQGAEVVRVVGGDAGHTAVAAIAHQQVVAAGVEEHPGGASEAGGAEDLATVGGAVSVTVRKHPVQPRALDRGAHDDQVVQLGHEGVALPVEGQPQRVVRSHAAFPEGEPGGDLTAGQSHPGDALWSGRVDEIQGTVGAQRHVHGARRHAGEQGHDAEGVDAADGPAGARAALDDRAGAEVRHVDAVIRADSQPDGAVGGRREQLDLLGDRRAGQQVEPSARELDAHRHGRVAGTQRRGLQPHLQVHRQPEQDRPLATRQLPPVRRVGQDHSHGVDPGGLAEGEGAPDLIAGEGGAHSQTQHNGLGGLGEQAAVRAPQGPRGQQVLRRVDHVVQQDSRDQRGPGDGEGRVRPGPHDLHAPGCAQRHAHHGAGQQGRLAHGGPEHEGVPPRAGRAHGERQALGRRSQRDGGRDVSVDTVEGEVQGSGLLALLDRVHGERSHAIGAAEDPQRVEAQAEVEGPLGSQHGGEVFERCVEGGEVQASAALQEERVGDSAQGLGRAALGRVRQVGVDGPQRRHERRGADGVAGRDGPLDPRRQLSEVGRQAGQLQVVGSVGGSQRGRRLPTHHRHRQRGRGDDQLLPGRHDPERVGAPGDGSSGDGNLQRQLERLPRGHDDRLGQPGDVQRCRRLSGELQLGGSVAGAV